MILGQMASSFSRLPPLPALRDFIHMYKLRAKKILSQNFIMDMNVNRKIVRSAGVREGDSVAEVGPGPGGITRAILEAGARRLDVIEIDHRFIPPLNHLSEAVPGRIFIHHNDVLKTDLCAIWRAAEATPSDAPPLPACDWFDEPPRRHIIGNLPFNIASPLIVKYLREMSYRRGPWEFGRVPLTLTFQLEVARRICAPLDCSARSRISIMAQYVSEPKLVFQIAGSCFVPQPDVDVGVVRFVPRQQSLIHAPFEIVEKLVRQVFHYRQKYCIKGLKTLYPEEMADELAHEVLKEARIDPKTTSIRLGIEQYADMAAIYDRQCRRIPGLFLYDYTKKKQKLADLAVRADALPPVNEYVRGGMPSEGISLRHADRYIS